MLRQLGDQGYQDLRVETTRIESSGDMAMEIGRYTVSIVEESGQTFIDQGKYLVVWRRLGAWRVAADCWSSNLPVRSAAMQEKPAPVAEKLNVLSNDAEKIA